MKPVTELDDAQLRNLVGNYQRLGKTGEPAYLAALKELARRTGAGLDFDKTFRAVLKAAKEHRFLSYKELADESGVEWDKVCRAMNLHLGDLIEYAHRRGWPLLSAIIVNKQNLTTGHMEPSTLRGFVEAARHLNFVVADEEQFLRAKQEKVFEWASEQGLILTPADTTAGK